MAWHAGTRERCVKYDHMDTCLFDKGKDKKWDGKCGKCYIGVDLAAGLLLCSVCMFPTQKEENRKLASMNMFFCKSIEILHF